MEMNITRSGGLCRLRGSRLSQSFRNCRLRDLRRGTIRPSSRRAWVPTVCRLASQLLVVVLWILTSNDCKKSMAFFIFFVQCPELTHYAFSVFFSLWVEGGDGMHLGSNAAVHTYVYK